MSAPLVLALRILLAIALYSFLGWTLYVLWRELQGQGQQLSTRAIPVISLSIRVGEQVLQRHFRQPQVTIGRDPSCDLIMNDETVSARHASLSYHHAQWWLEDLGSTNGVIVNQERIAIPIVVMTGDRFQCGDVELTIQIESTENSADI